MTRPGNGIGPARRQCAPCGQAGAGCAGLTDGAPGGRSPLRQAGARLAKARRRVAPNPPKGPSPGLWRPPGAPFPIGEAEKGKPACPAP